MQFLISVIDDATNTGTSEEMDAITEFNRGLRANGQLIFAGGLSEPLKATRFDNRADKNEVFPGPLHESKEYVSGFWIIEAPSLEVATELAKQGSLSCNRKVELRPFLD
ncbi:MAG: YciI family protein [Actinomycetota bacterium]